MKKNRILLLAFCAVMSVPKLFGQKAEPATFSFSAQQAVDYAIQNHSSVKNAAIDEIIAKDKVREIRGLGMPQISGSFDVKDFWEIPTSLIPGDFFGRPGSYIPVKFGTQYNTTAGLEASQLVFSSDYLIGLKATKVYYELLQKSTTRTRIETTVMVEKAYYSVLINEERLKLLDANVQKVNKLKDDTQALLENGFVEQVDYDRIVIANNNLVTEKEKVARFVELSYALLKFQMGMDQTATLSLTDKLDAVKIEVPAESADKFDYEKRIEFSLLDAQKRGAELQLKKDRGSFLPMAVLYSGLSANLQKNELDVFNTANRWYPTGIVGFKVSLPIFDGFQKHYRVQQSKLGLVKVQNSMETLRGGIDLELKSARIGLANSAASVSIQKKNMELASSVFDTAKKKYDEGIGSNLEVLNAETSLKEAQTNYYSALFDAMNAKIDFDKANGNLK